MSNSNLKIDLHPREDKDSRIFYVGKLKFPGSINCKDGVSFIIFIAENGSEQLQICPMQDKND